MDEQSLLLLYHIPLSTLDMGTYRRPCPMAQHHPPAQVTSIQPSSSNQSSFFAGCRQPEHSLSGTLSQPRPHPPQLFRLRQPHTFSTDRAMRYSDHRCCVNARSYCASRPVGAGKLEIKNRLQAPASPVSLLQLVCVQPCRYSSLLSPALRLEPGSARLCGFTPGFPIMSP